MIIIKLPIPPSVNAAYANNKAGKGRGRYRTERYTTWANAAGWDIKAQRPEKLTGHFAIQLIMDASKRRNSDLDNRIKCVLDLLQTHKIIEDDKYCDSLSISWGHAPEGCVVFLSPSFSNSSRAA